MPDAFFERSRANEMSLPLVAMLQSATSDHICYYYRLRPDIPSRQQPWKDINPALPRHDHRTISNPRQTRLTPRTFSMGDADPRKVQ